MGGDGLGWTLVVAGDCVIVRAKDKEEGENVKRGL